MISLRHIGAYELRTEASKEFRPFKTDDRGGARTFKAPPTAQPCGYDNYEGASYNVSLWVAYYNFLRPHQHNHTIVFSIKYTFKFFFEAILTFVIFFPAIASLPDIHLLAKINNLLLFLPSALSAIEVKHYQEL